MQGIFRWGLDLSGVVEREGHQRGPVRTILRRDYRAKGKTQESEGNWQVRVAADKNALDF